MVVKNAKRMALILNQNLASRNPVKVSAISEDFKAFVTASRFNSCPIQYNAQPFVTNCILPCVIVDGSWGQWSQWSLCSKTCGDGVHVRSRICDDPKPAAGGATCTGTSTQEKYCRMRDCCKSMNRSVHRLNSLRCTG